MQFGQGRADFIITWLSIESFDYRHLFHRLDDRRIERGRTTVQLVEMLLEDIGILLLSLSQLTIALPHLDGGARPDLRESSLERLHSFPTRFRTTTSIRRVIHLFTLPQNPIVFRFDDRALQLTTSH